MKKIYTLCFASLIGFSAYAQTQPERIVVHQKSGEVVGYQPSAVDSISFPLVEGKVAADVEVLEVGIDQATIKVTRTPSCEAFKLANIPAVTANRLTEDIAMINYVNQATNQFYYANFEAGILKDASMQADTKYVLVTVGYDKYKTPCSVVRVPYKTAKKPLVGDPQVTSTVAEVGKRSFTLNFKPNADVGGFATVAGKVGEMQMQFEQWGTMMGLKNFGDLVKSWGVQNPETFTWNDMEPNTDYEVFVQAWDKENTYADCDTLKVKTEKLGDSGAAAVEVLEEEYKYAEWDGMQLPTVVLTFSPNQSSSCYRYKVVLKSEYEKDPEGHKSELPMDPPMPSMVGWFFYEPLTTEFQINPNVEYVVLTVAKNGDNKWGEVGVKMMKTPAEVPGAKPGPVGPLSIQSKIGTRDVKVKTIYLELGKVPEFMKSAPNRSTTTLK